MRKYPETKGYYCYCHITPDEMFYIGFSKQRPYDRWKPSKYKNCSLQPYIEKYGWGNIRHVILKDGFTEDQARKLEGLLIEEAKRQGFCINDRRSGGIERDNPKEYKREYSKTEKWKEYDKKRNQTAKRKEYNRNYQREYKREYQKTEKWKEYHREYQRQYRLKKKQEKLLSNDVS